MGVRDDRDRTVGQRQLDPLADQVRVALVVGVDGDGGVTEHRLDTGGRDDDRLVPLAVCEGDQLAGVVLVVDLGVREGRHTARAPVDDALGAVDHPVVEQVLEDRLDGLGEALVHGEALTRPVQARAEAAQLAEDATAVLLLPLPGPLDERLTADVVPRLTLFGELLLDLVLGGDTGVVHARQPQRLEALHPLAAGEGVHQRDLEGVAQVEGAGDVGRWDDDGVRRLLTLRVGFEVTTLYPALVQLPLYIGRRVRGRQFGVAGWLLR